MKTKIAAATIVHRGHPDNGEVRDLWIENGTIVSIESPDPNKSADRVIAEEGLCVSIGWMDLRANFRDPGQEWKENLTSGMAAAARGGFTRVALSPDTLPPMDHKGAVEYALSRGLGGPVALSPIGAMTKKLDGSELSEMYDMYNSGARAFGNAKRSLKDSGILHRALLYTTPFGAPLFHFPYDMGFAEGAQINEGVQSVMLGMKGSPTLAEETVTDRDLSVLGHAGGRLHLGPLSSIGSVRRVAAAKAQGLDVTCETSAAHLAFSENELEDFDTGFKLMPPLRTESNRKALIEALKSGDLDVVSSDHSPEDEESKKREFEHAAYGTAGIETFFPLLYDRIGANVPLDVLTASFSSTPRRILGLNIPEIKTGARAELTVFSTALSTEVKREHLNTKAYNVAELGKTLRGRVIETVVG